MTYCISDIHGCYEEFMELLRKINFNSNDALYILGDAIDRGEASIKCLMRGVYMINTNLFTGKAEAYASARPSVDGLLCREVVTTVYSERLED